MEALDQLEHRHRFGEVARKPRAEMGHRSEGDEGGRRRHVEVVAVRLQGRGDGIDHEAVLLAILGRDGEASLRVGVRPRGGTARNGPRQGMGRDARPVTRHQKLGRGAEEDAVGHRHGKDGAVRLPGAQPPQHGREVERIMQCHGEGAGEDDLFQGGSRDAHGGDRAGDDVAVVRGRHGARQERRAGGAGRHGTGLVAGLGRGAVLPDDGVEQVVRGRQRNVVGSDRRRPPPRLPVGVDVDAHGEAGDDELPGVHRLEGERAERQHATAGPSHLVVTGDGTEHGGRLAHADEARGAPPHQGEPGPVEEHGRAAVELQRVRPVVERDGAGVQPGPGHGVACHGLLAPARVATMSWLRPPANGRMPTAEKPASSTMCRSLCAGGR